MATNSAIDALAGAFPAPAGPLTRVTDLNAMSIDGNEDIKLEFTTDSSAPALGASYTVYLSYNELNSDGAETLVYQQIGTPHKVYDLVDRLDTFNTTVQALTVPYGQDDYQTIIQGLRTNFPEIRGY